MPTNNWKNNNQKQKTPYLMSKRFILLFMSPKVFLRISLNEREIETEKKTDREKKN